jgi:hypothetical protein
VLGLSYQRSEGAKFRKTIKTRGHFPTEEAARKLIYLLDHLRSEKLATTYNWNAALLSFKIHFGDPNCPDPTLGCRGKFGDVDGWQS